MVELLICQSKGPDRFAILAAVRRKGKSLSQLARDNGAPLSSYTNAITRPDSPSGEFAIAELLQVHPAALWPERWQNPSKKRAEWLEKNSSRIRAWAKCLPLGAS